MMILLKIFALCLAWTCVQSNNQEGKLYFVQKSGSSNDIEALMIVTWRETEEAILAQCEYSTDKAEIDESLKSTTTPPTEVSEDDMEDLLKDCSELTGRKRRESGEEVENEIFTSDYMEAPGRATTIAPNDNSDTTTPGYDGIPVIFPGTKWCGAGDRAKSYEDLGLHQDTDRCCRAHDLCNDTLAPGETRNDLTNSSPFTKLSCKCDNDFHGCLSRVNSFISNTIGNTYFNVLRRECYQEDYPLTTKCIKYRSFFQLGCKEYERDTTKPKVAQWIPAKKYKKLPIPGPLDIELPL